MRRAQCRQQPRGNIRRSARLLCHVQAAGRYWRLGFERLGYRFNGAEQRASHSSKAASFAKCWPDIFPVAFIETSDR